MILKTLISALAALCLSAAAQTKYITASDGRQLALHLDTVVAQAQDVMSMDMTDTAKGERLIVFIYGCRRDRGVAQYHSLDNVSHVSPIMRWEVNLGARAKTLDLVVSHACLRAYERGLIQ